ncbi:MAG: PadR family transcriptional regulator [Halioglobus sp.]
MKNLPKLSPTSYAMLGLLARSPQSAYELNTRMQTSLIRAFWPRAESHVYSEPKKLLAHELVSERKEENSGRKRTVYTITDRGREVLLAWLQNEAGAELRMQAEFMLKLILADNGSTQDAKSTLALSLAASQKDLEEAIEGIQRILDNPGYATEGMPYNGIVINLMADMLIARYRWGRFALEATANLTDGSSEEERHKAGREAYAAALAKMRDALGDTGV